MVQEVADRAHKHIRGIQDYLEVRRDTSGAKPCFALLELDMNLPDEAIHHPVIEELYIISIDMILLGNVGYIFPPFSEVDCSALAIGYRFVQLGAGTRR